MSETSLGYYKTFADHPSDCSDLLPALKGEAFNVKYVKYVISDNAAA
jgi:hypothetical protein